MVIRRSIGSNSQVPALPRMFLADVSTLVWLLISRTSLELVSMKPPLPLVLPPLASSTPETWVFFSERTMICPPLPCSLAFALILLVSAKAMVLPLMLIWPPLPVLPLALAMMVPEFWTLSAKISITPPLLTIELVLMRPLFLITEPISWAAELAAITTIPPST